MMSWAKWADHKVEYLEVVEEIRVLADIEAATRWMGSDGAIRPIGPNVGVVGQMVSHKQDMPPGGA
jgi:hypothetical protein